MNRKDVIWQEAIEAESQRLMALPPGELLDLESYSSGSIEFGELTIEYGLWHENPEYRDEALHAFVLMAQRNLFVGYRKYLTGFSLNQRGEVVPISDETLYAYD